MIMVKMEGAPLAAEAMIAAAQSMELTIAFLRFMLIPFRNWHKFR
jgi:hypothetical protein